MFDDAISNYKQKIMIQTSAIKFILRTIVGLGWVRKVGYPLKCHKIFFKTAKIGGTPPAYTN